MIAIAIVGLILSVVALATTERVSKWIAPRGEGFSAFPRTFLSIGWFVFGPFVSFAGILVFGLLLALALK